MINVHKSSYTKKPIFNTQNIILASIGWGVLAILYFLLFSAKVPDTQGTLRRAEWYVLGTNILEAWAYLFAGILCLRNWRSSKIVSSRNVWLAIGMGMLSYFLGGIFFGFQEIVLKKEPTLSYGDIFFVLTYILLGVGMIVAVASRRINLEVWQWIIVLAIGAFGSALVWLISNLPENQQLAVQLSPWEQNVFQFVNWFYVVSDVLLIMIATTLLLAFWGGRIAMSWRMIAFASFFLYIADMWFKYAGNRPDYQSGDILEVFWVLSGVLFGMGAALEHDASLNRSRRERTRKRA